MISFCWPQQCARNSAGEAEEQRRIEPVFTGCLGVVWNTWVERDFDPLKDVQMVYWEDPRETL